MGWHALSGLDRRPDQVRTSEGQPGSIPVHGVASEDLGQRLKGHVQLAQIERLFQLFTTPDQVEHDERRAQREVISGLFQPNASQYQAFLFARLVSVVRGKAGGERLREEFRMALLRLDQMSAIFSRVSDASLVMGFTFKEQTDVFLSTGWGVGFHLYWIHHHPIV